MWGETDFVVRWVYLPEIFLVKDWAVISVGSCHFWIEFRSMRWWIDGEAFWMADIKFQWMIEVSLQPCVAHLFPLWSKACFEVIFVEWTIGWPDFFFFLCCRGCQTGLQGRWRLCSCEPVTRISSDAVIRPLRWQEEINAQVVNNGWWEWDMRVLCKYIIIRDALMEERRKGLF